MMNIWLSSILLLVSIGLFGCHVQENTFPDAYEDTDADDEDSDTGETSSKLDLLLVLHTAYFQNEYMASLTMSLEETVVRPLLEAGIDTRVGILSADMGSAGYLMDEMGPACSFPCDRPDGTSSSDDGLLSAWPPCWPEGPVPLLWSESDPPSCGPFLYNAPLGSWPYFMDASDPDFNIWLSCFANREDGCYIPQPLESMYAFLEAGRNPEFLRSGSVLAILILTAQDDCSIYDPRVFDDDQIVVPIGTYSKCAYYQEYLYSLSRYLNRIFEVRDSDHLAVGVFTGPDEEYRWCTDSEPGLCPCNTNQPCLVPGPCTTDVVYSSPRLHQFARLLGYTTLGSRVGISAESCPAFAGWGTTPDAELSIFTSTILDRF